MKIVIFSVTTWCKFVCVTNILEEFLPNFKGASHLYSENHHPSKENGTGRKPDFVSSSVVSIHTIVDMTNAKFANIL
jgi:hypothetical protein